VLGIRKVAIDPLDAQESFRLTVGLLGVYGILVGMLGLLYDPDRYTASSYSDIVAVPGGVIFWSLVVLLNSFVMLGALIRCGKKTMAVTLFLGSTWCSALTVGFLTAYLSEQDASPLGFAACAAMAAVHSLQGWVAWSSRNVEFLRIADVRLADDNNDIEE